jgi:hypothetical protein
MYYSVVECQRNNVKGYEVFFVNANKHEKLGFFSGRDKNARFKASEIINLHKKKIRNDSE